MKEKEKRKQNLFKLALVAVTGVVIAGMAIKTKKLKRENLALNNRVANLEGRNANQSYLISGLQRQIERLSYINGKLSKTL